MHIGGKPPNPHFSIFLGGKPRTPTKAVNAQLSQGRVPEDLWLCLILESPRSTDLKYVSCLRFWSRLFLDHLKCPSSLSCAFRKRIFGGLGKTLEQSPTRNLLYLVRFSIEPSSQMFVSNFPFKSSRPLIQER